MSTDSEVIAVPQEEVALVLQATDPSAVVARATRVANALADIIERKQLYNTISGKKHVRVEGWTSLAALHGVVPREVSVTREDGVYTATMELVHVQSGSIVGRASAECGAADESWATRPSNARRSMALTRATSKACRLTFSWIMALAGYSPTPAEEVPPEGFEEDSRPPRASQGPKKGSLGKIWPFDGPKKGTLLADLTVEELRVALAWIRKTHKGEDLVQPIMDLLAQRMADQPEPAA